MKGEGDEEITGRVGFVRDGPMWVMEAIHVCLHESFQIPSLGRTELLRGYEPYFV